MRQLGTYDQSFNYEVTIEGMLDARMLVPTYTDLLAFDESNYLPNGFIVSVIDTDLSLAGLYRLIDNTDLSNPDSWVKVGADYTFNSGLTNTAGVVKLGGTLTGTAQISSNGNTFKIFDFAGDAGYIITSPGQANIAYNTLSGNLASGIQFTSSIMRVYDIINSKGLFYDGDYSSNNISNPRWIPDKAYIDSAIPSIAGLVPYTGATEDVNLASQLIFGYGTSNITENQWVVGKNPRFGNISFTSDGLLGTNASTAITFNTGDASSKTIIYYPSFYSDQRLHFGTDAIAYLSDITTGPSYTFNNGLTGTTTIGLGGTVTTDTTIDVTTGSTLTIGPNLGHISVGSGVNLTSSDGTNYATIGLGADVGGGHPGSQWLIGNFSSGHDTFVWLQAIGGILVEDELSGIGMSYNRSYASANASNPRWIPDKGYVDAAVAGGGGGTGTVTSVSIVSANGFTGSVATSTTTPAITLTLQNATTSQSGQLTSTDWNTFNSKQPAGSYLIANQTITWTPTGDVTGSTTGTTSLTPVLSIGAGKVTNTMLAGSIAFSKLVGTDITTVGTIGAGVWQGTLVGPTYGGTGVNNGSKTITLGGNLVTSGAFATTLTSTATTSITLPTSGTLYGTASGSISSSQLATSMSDETGTGALVFANSPVFAGTPSLPTGTTGVLQTTGDSTTKLATTSFVQQELTNSTIYFDSGDFGGTGTISDPITTIGGGGGFTNPMTAVGDLIVGGTSGAGTRLAIGSTGQYLRVTSGTGAWTTIPSTDLPDFFIDSTYFDGDGLASGTKLTLKTLGVPIGGTGLTTLTAYAILAGGTTSTGNLQQVSGLGTSGQVLTSSGTGALPTWTTISGFVPYTGASSNLDLNGHTLATTINAAASTVNPAITLLNSTANTNSMSPSINFLSVVSSNTRGVRIHSIGTSAHQHLAIDSTVDNSTWLPMVDISETGISTFYNGTGFTAVFDYTGNTVNRTYTLPDKNGTVAMLSDITVGQLALVPTAVKTANYTAVAGDLVPVDTTSGAITITLPTTPTDKSRVAVKHITQGSTNIVTINTGGSDVFNKTGGSTSGSLKLLNQGITMQYASSSGIWYVLSDDLPLSGLDLRYLSNVITTTGDLPYSASGATLSRLGIGTTGYVLTVVSGVPAWAPATPSFSTQTANTVLAGPTTGSAATPAFRALVSADMPLFYFDPAYFSGGGTSTGDYLTLVAASIPFSKLVGTDITSVGTVTVGAWHGTVIGSTYGGTGVNNGSSTITIGGNVTLSGAFTTTLTVTATTAVTLPTSGTLYGTATGSITSAQMLASLSDETGTGALVFANTPTLVTPILGAATATTINKVTITQPTTSATLTLITGSSLITSGAFALTLTSSATSNATIPAGTNTLYSTKSGSITSAQLATSLTDETGTGVTVFSDSPTFTTLVTLPVISIGLANKIGIVEGTGGRTGQTTLVAGTIAITISGVTTSSRAFVTLVAQGGTSTTVYAYKAVCTANTLTITAETVAGVAVTTDTSILNYLIVN